MVRIWKNTALLAWTLIAIFVGSGLLVGCGSSNRSRTDPNTTRRTFSYDSRFYHVEIQQTEWKGRCVERRALFTTHNRLYYRPHVDRVQIVDSFCDAMFVDSFEQLQIMRSPLQERRYLSDMTFRQRINRDLWDVYETALFTARWI